MPATHLKTVMLLACNFVKDRLEIGFTNQVPIY